jgi:hypothetical protein
MTNTADTTPERNSEGRWNGRVGQILVSESKRVRVWHIALAPGERLDPHCHVLDNFWTVLTPGKARSTYGDGRVEERVYSFGDTGHLTLGPGEFFTHDLVNIGDTVLSYTTVEFLDSANEPLPLTEEAYLRR